MQHWRDILSHLQSSAEMINVHQELPCNCWSQDEHDRECRGIEICYEIHTINCNHAATGLFVSDFFNVLSGAFPVLLRETSSPHVGHSQFDSRVGVGEKKELCSIFPTKLPWQISNRVLHFCWMIIVAGCQDQYTGGHLWQPGFDGASFLSFAFPLHSLCFLDMTPARKLNNNHTSCSQRDYDLKAWWEDDWMESEICFNSWSIINC